MVKLLSTAELPAKERVSSTPPQKEMHPELAPSFIIGVNCTECIPIINATWGIVVVGLDMIIITIRRADRL